MLPFFISDEMGFSDEELLLFAAASGKAVEATATGNPLAFVTDLARPLKSLLIPFTPVQSGTGDPSPQNIRSILPWNGLTVFGGGKNLIQDNKNLQPIFMPKGTKLFASIKRGATSVNNPSVMFYTENKTPIDYWTLNNSYMDGRVGRGFTLTDDVYWFSIVTNDANALERQLEIGTSGSAYEPYTPITETDISFPSPVYGGEHEAVSGRLSSEWAEIASYNGENLPGEWLSDRDVYSAGTTPTIGAQVVYKLATPQEITLTPEQINALKGENTIWSDADGSMTAVYMKKG